MSDTPTIVIELLNALGDEISIKNLELLGNLITFRLFPLLINAFICYD